MLDSADTLASVGKALKNVQTSLVPDFAKGSGWVSRYMIWLFFKPMTGTVFSVAENWSKYGLVWRFNLVSRN